jgi:hypothetical protein
MNNHERESSRAPAGDTALDRAWQQLSDEQPPSALDAAIIAAAHKSIQDRDGQAQVKRAGPPQRSWLTRWQPLAAAATVAGLAFVLVQSLPRDRDVAPSLHMEEPAAAPAAAQERPGIPASREAIEAKTASPPAPAVVRESVTAPASVIEQESAADTATTMPAAEVDQRQPAAAEMPGRTTSEAAAAPAPVQTTAAKAAAARDDVARPDATDRAARIASLYATGDIAGAADALREFREVDPGADTYLPASLRDWARTVE